ncbi:nucleotide exchange factor GrpE [Cesiribacter sp. SM1]|uniref:nucleotide exchange factor GrpE n=1 Tax=Cesiribacter sp. SM1 TaxID=2861196 RepID=UPI001CD72A94|nr:nucleotide exchange factor GrpE [Cesiribacter sp. SM1]
MSKDQDKDKDIVNERPNGAQTASEHSEHAALTDTETPTQSDVSDQAQSPEVEEEQRRGELEEQKEKYLRLYSEFENFRRRTAKEKMELTRTANEEMASAMLPVLDDFERAIKAFEKDNSQSDSTKEGMMLIYNKFKSALERKGVKVMQVEAGSEFDAEYQEAITQIPAPDESLKGKVVDVVEKGYTLGDKVIRFAKVVIGA